MPDSASPKQAFLTKDSKANGKGSQRGSRSTASLHSHPQTQAPRSPESKAEKKLSGEQAAMPARPAPAAGKDGDARSVRKGAALGPPPPPAAPLVPGDARLSQSHPAKEPSPGGKHHQLSLGWNNSRHLLVQNEVQVKSPVAGWTPFLPASPLPGADEHKSGQRETLEANAQGFLLHGGHDLQPKGEGRVLSPHAPRTRQDPQGRAIRGALLSGPLFPLALPKNSPEAIVWRSSRFSFWFPLRFCF